MLVRLPDWWKSGRPSRPAVKVTIGQSKPSSLGLNALLDFKAEVTLDGEELTDAEWQTIVSSTEGLVFLRGKWVESDPEKLREVLAHWKKLERARLEEGVSFAEAFRLLAGMQPGVEADSMEPDSAKEWSFVHGGAWIGSRLAELRDPRASAAPVPGGFKAELRHYQHSGLHWLRFMARLGLGACLADDMGLGKTVQVLAALQHWRAESPGASPALLVAPASLLGNWQAEAAKFAPALRFLIAHPSAGVAIGLTKGNTRKKRSPPRDLRRHHLRHARPAGGDAPVSMEPRDSGRGAGDQESRRPPDEGGQGTGRSRARGAYRDTGREQPRRSLVAL